MAGDSFAFDDIDVAWLRTRTGAKWHRHPGRWNAWVADMDMPPAEVVLDVIRARVERGDLGYPDWGYPNPRSPVCALFAERAEARYGWSFDPAEVREFCDVVQAVQVMLHLGTEPGDAVVLHTPSYPPLWRSLASMGRRQIDIPAIIDDDGVRFDLDALEARLAHEPATALLLCNPHNPTGHVFDRAELQRLLDIANRFDLLVISDEIHADLTYEPSVHVPFAGLPGAAARTVTMHSASKAFNLAGMRHAVAHVGPEAIRRRLAELPDHLLGAVNLIAAEATEAAWRHGDDWLTAVVAHLDRNRRQLADLLSRHLSAVRYRPPAATYLAWLDCRALGAGSSPVELFRSRGVELSDGNDFGPAGAGHVRVNFATSSAVLTTIVEQMAG
jgi:cystathionine beta-lyase